MGVMEVTSKGLLLKEINPEYTIDEIKFATEAELIIAENPINMELIFSKIALRY